MRTLTPSLGIFRAALAGGCLPPAKASPLDRHVIQTAPIIIDHTCTDAGRIPASYNDIARKTFGVACGHTSHGSQIVSGIKALMDQDPRFAFDPFGSRKALSLFDHEPPGDPGNPARRAWATRTRQLLDEGWGNVDVVVWSWCGPVSTASPGDIQRYLDLMQDWENHSPGVIFVYVTGHLDGSGKNGNRHQRNDEIRRCCNNDH